MYDNGFNWKKIEIWCWIMSKKNTSCYTRNCCNSKIHKYWLNEIRNYLGVCYSEAEIINLALAYTLQSIRVGEDISRFKWDDFKC